MLCMVLVTQTNNREAKRRTLSLYAPSQSALQGSVVNCVSLSGNRCGLVSTRASPSSPIVLMQYEVLLCTTSPFLHLHPILNNRSASDKSCVCISAHLHVAQRLLVPGNGEVFFASSYSFTVVYSMTSRVQSDALFSIPLIHFE